MRHAEGNREPSLAARLRGDVLVALSSAILTLPVAIACGVIAFSPLGGGYAPVAALAGLTAAGVAAIVGGIAGGSRYQITGPVGSLAIILATTLAAFLVDPSLGGSPQERAPAAVVLVFMCVALAGLIQVALGLLRLGDLVKFIPHSVVAGFMGGVALRILMSQAPLFADIPKGGLPALLAEGITLQPVGLMIAGAVAAVMLLAGVLLKRRGDALVALVAGTAAVLVLEGTTGLQPPGGHIGAIANQIPLPHQAENAWIVLSQPGAAYLLLKLAVPAGVIAILGGLQSLLAAAAMDARTDTRHASNRELIGQGLANIAAGAFGGVAVAGSAPRSLASYLAGSRSRLAGILHGALFLGLAAFGAGIVGSIPLAVIAGILVVYSFRIGEGWLTAFVAKLKHAHPGRERRDALFDLVVVLVVGGLTAFGELLPAVGVGVAVASFLFVVQSGRDPIHRERDATHAHSRTHRPLGEMSFLSEHGRAIAIAEAEGHIFFGSAERLADRLTEIAADARYVILDIRRVGEIDSTGAAILRRLRGQFERDGKTLLFAYLTPTDRRWPFLAEMGVVEEDGERFFTDTDAALAWAEDRLLETREAPAMETELALAEMEILTGLDADGLAALAGILVRREYAAGDVLFEEGDTGDVICILAKGWVTAQGLIDGDPERPVRLAGMGRACCSARSRCSPAPPARRAPSPKPTPSAGFSTTGDSSVCRRKRRWRRSVSSSISPSNRRSASTRRRATSAPWKAELRLFVFRHEGPDAGVPAVLVRARHDADALVDAVFRHLAFDGEQRAGRMIAERRRMLELAPGRLDGGQHVGRAVTVVKLPGEGADRPLCVVLRRDGHLHEGRMT